MGTDTLCVCQPLFLLVRDFVSPGTVKSKKAKKSKLEADMVLTCSPPNSGFCL